MRILVTNDDGIHAPGLETLERIARTISDDVWIVAPAEENSGAGHSLSLADPIRYRKLAEKVMRYHGHAHRALELRPGTVVDLLQRLDALRQAEALEPFLLACEADARGRPGFEQRPYPQAGWLRAARAAAVAVPVQPLLEQGLKGEALGAALRRARIAAVKAAGPQWSAPT